MLARFCISRPLQYSDQQWRVPPDVCSVHAPLLGTHPNHRPVGYVRINACDRRILNVFAYTVADTLRSTLRQSCATERFNDLLFEALLDRSQMTGLGKYV